MSAHPGCRACTPGPVCSIAGCCRRAAGGPSMAHRAGVLGGPQAETVSPALGRRGGLEGRPSFQDPRFRVPPPSPPPHQLLTGCAGYCHVTPRCSRAAFCVRSRCLVSQWAGGGEDLEHRGLQGRQLRSSQGPWGKRGPALLCVASIRRLLSARVPELPPWLPTKDTPQQTAR